MKKITFLITFIFLMFSFVNAQDGSKTKDTKKNTANSAATAGTSKSNDHKKAPSSVTAPTSVNLPLYTPRTASGPEPKKTLPKKNSEIK